jgi:hypothetical protein
MYSYIAIATRRYCRRWGSSDLTHRRAFILNVSYLSLLQYTSTYFWYPWWKVIYIRFDEQLCVSFDSLDGYIIVYNLSGCYGDKVGLRSNFTPFFINITGQSKLPLRISIILLIFFISIIWYASIIVTISSTLHFLKNVL